MTEHELVELLLDPAAYPWTADSVTHIETHISHLFFAGNRVVKIKRPVRFGFVDLTTLASREQACRDEIRLNRRLTDDVYLDVLPIVHTKDGARVGGNGVPIEWATVMRRFPAESTLDHMLESGTAPTDIAEQLAARLIPFHLHAVRCTGSPQANAANAERILRENLDEIAALDDGLIFPREFDLVRARLTALIDGLSSSMLLRALAGMIREGHGDLKCEHVLLDPPGSLQIFDCVEFSLAIRCADIASDLAFLLLDLERLGAADQASEIVQRYRESGVDLPDDHLLLYRLHRGLVRVKTLALALQAHSQRAPSPKLVAWLHLVFRTAYRVQPVAIAMTGFSGSGKSHVAREIAALTGGVIVSTDTLRRELEPDPVLRYSPAARLANYRQLFERAASVVLAGSAVILDGTFLGENERTLAADFAASHGLPLVFATVHTDPGVAQRRMARRRAGESPSFDSEASLDVFLDQQKAPPAPFPADAAVVQLDTTADGPVSLDALLQALQASGLLIPRSA